MNLTGKFTRIRVFLSTTETLWPSSASRKTPGWLLVRSLLTLIMISTLGTIAAYRLGALDKLAFDDSSRTALTAANPKYIFIGNSMVYSRLDSDYMSEQLGGQKVYLLTSGGGMSAQAYLFLKNSVIPSGVRPKQVVFFFRDTFLTEPAMRTSGEYVDNLQRSSHDYEPLYDWILTGRSLPWPSRVALAFRRFVPLHRFRDAVEDWMDSTSLAATNSVFDPRDEVNRKDSINALFGLDQMTNASVKPASRHEMNTNFKSAVEGSFLPAVIALGCDHNVPLFFVRVQRRPTGNHPPRQSDAMIGYIENLQRYLLNAGAGFFDMNAAEMIPESFYSEGDHIADDRRHEYTDLLISRIPELFGGPAVSMGPTL